MSSVPGADRAHRLASLLEAAHRHSALPSPVAMLTGREQWETLLSLLLGRQPVLGRMRAGDLPYLRAGQDARRLARTVSHIWVRCTNKHGNRLELVDSGRRARRIQTSSKRGANSQKAQEHDSERRYERPFRLDEFLSLLGLLAHQESQSLEGDSLRAYFDRRVHELLRFFLELAPPAGVLLTQLFDVPYWNLSSLAGPPPELPGFLLGDDPASLPPGRPPMRRAAALLSEQRWESGRGSAVDEPVWSVVHIVAMQIQNFVRRFSISTLHRGASAIVQEALCCIREGLVAEHSIVCLIRDLGGHLTFLLPSDNRSVEAQGEGSSARNRRIAECLRSRIESIVQRGLGDRGGYFASQYPRERARAKVGAKAIGIPLRAWAKRGLFPDFEIRVSETRLSEIVSSLQPKLDEQRVVLRADRGLLASPPSRLEPRCFGCHMEQGRLPAKWYPPNRTANLLCPRCLVVLAAGQRVSQQSHQGVIELARSVLRKERRVARSRADGKHVETDFLSSVGAEAFSRSIMTTSLKEAVGERAVTLYLDGAGVGRRFSKVPFLRASTESLLLEEELRTRYQSAMRRLFRIVGSTADCKPLRCLVGEPAASNALFAFPVLFHWMGGDDLCLSLQEDLAADFLRGFYSASSRRGVTYNAGLLFHSTAPEEMSRVGTAVRELLDEAKTLSYSNASAPAGLAESSTGTIAMAAMPRLEENGSIQVRRMQRAYVANVEEAVDWIHQQKAPPTDQKETARTAKSRKARKENQLDDIYRLVVPVAYNGPYGGVPELQIVNVLHLHNEARTSPQPSVMRLQLEPLPRSAQIRKFLDQLIGRPGWSGRHLMMSRSLPALGAGTIPRSVKFCKAPGCGLPAPAGAISCPATGHGLRRQEGQWNCTTFERLTRDESQERHNLALEDPEGRKILVELIIGKADAFYLELLGKRPAIEALFNAIQRKIGNQQPLARDPELLPQLEQYFDHTSAWRLGETLLKFSNVTLRAPAQPTVATVSVSQEEGAVRHVLVLDETLLAGSVDWRSKEAISEELEGWLGRVLEPGEILLIKKTPEFHEIDLDVDARLIQIPSISTHLALAIRRGSAMSLKLPAWAAKRLALLGLGAGSGATSIPVSVYAENAWCLRRDSPDDGGPAAVQEQNPSAPDPA